MYYKISDFVSDFDLETATTLKVINNLSWFNAVSAYLTTAQLKLIPRG